MMTRRMWVVVMLVTAVVAAPEAQQNQRPQPPPSIDDRTNGMKKLDGYFPLYWDERTGSMFLEISRWDTDFLFSNGLSAGLGSNDIGLDRGQGGGSRIARFERVGPRVMLVQPNQNFRSSSKNPAERKSVEDSFAKSILWGFTVAAESNNRVLVDATQFFLRDMTNAANSLRPGNYRVDPTRSAFYLPNTRNFPKNTEVDVTLTFVNDATGGGGGGGGGPTQGPTPIGPFGPAPGGGGGGGGGGGFGGGLFSGTVASVAADGQRRDPPRARLARRAARQQLHAARRRSARRLRWPDLPRLQRAGRRADADALHPPASSAEEGSQRGDQRTDQADPVLGGQRRAGRREEGAPRRRELVEPGVRSRRLPQRVQGGCAAGGCRSDGHPLQHDQLGPPLDPRLELGRQRLGSAHRRDHPGDGDARLAPRSPGLHDLRGPALAVRQGRRAAGDPVRDRAGAHQAALRA